MKPTEYDTLRLALAAALASTPVPSGDEAWSETDATPEIFRVEPQWRCHRAFVVGLGRSAFASRSQPPGEPLEATTAVTVEAWWRLTPQGQPTTRDTGHYALIEILRQLRTTPFLGLVLADAAEVLSSAEPEWVRLVLTLTVRHTVSA